MVEGSKDSCFSRRRTCGRSGEIVMEIMIVVDVQRDFLLGGSLYIPDTKLLPHDIALRSSDMDLVISTRDWHPGNHMSFKNYGGIWPSHCVKGSPGADLHPLIDRISDIIISKGTDANKEAYSGFTDTSLGTLLHSKARHFDPIYIVGLATDYCVKATALDAIKYGFSNVIVLKQLIRGVHPVGSENAFNEMRKAGIRIA